MAVSKRICVFCGSSHGNDPRHRAAAVALADALVERSMGLVYGGGNVGLMGVVADQVLARGGEVIGVIPKALATKEVAHWGLTELRVVAGMHARKQEMFELADSFVALPGGIGTLEEFFEMLTWGQLGMHTKPCGLLNTAGYYDRLLGFLDGSVEEGFYKPKHRAMVLVAERADALLDLFETYEAPGGDKWIAPGEG